MFYFYLPVTSELTFLIYLVLKLTTVISNLSGKTRDVRKPFLQYVKGSCENYQWANV